MPADDQISGSTRDQLLAEYAAKNIVARATTRPYKSRLGFRWPVVNTIAASVAFAKLLAGTQLEYFSFGVGQAIPLTGVGGALATKPATEGDTNQSNARNTNGIEDFCIESISASLSGVRCEYAAADAQVVALGLTDPDVINAFQGRDCIIDPGNLIAPPELVSPFNLEVPLWDGLKSNVAITFEWDRHNKIPIGTLDQIPEGGAKSYLRASGQPSTSNRYRVPEGYAWRAKSRTDGDFIIRATVTDTVVASLDLIPPAGQGSTNSTPVALYTDVTLRVHGLGFSNVSQN